MGEPIRVFVADDHEVVRDGIRYRVEKDPELVWVGEAEDGVALTIGIEQSRADVLVLDLSMPHFPNPIGAVSTLAKQNASLHILILTIYEDTELAASLIEAGARGYLIKDTFSSNIITAIKHIAAGGLWLAPQVADALLQRSKPLQTSVRPADSSPLPALAPLPAASLTAREEEILRLIGEGDSTEEIAGKLAISPATVRTHMKRIYSKIGVNSRAQAVLYASRLI